MKEKRRENGKYLQASWENPWGDGNGQGSAGWCVRGMGQGNLGSLYRGAKKKTGKKKRKEAAKREAKPNKNRKGRPAVEKNRAWEPRAF